MAANKKAGGAAPPTGSKFKTKTNAADHARLWHVVQRAHAARAAALAHAGRVQAHTYSKARGRA